MEMKKEKITYSNICKHYMRKCKIIAPCCNKLYCCQICHDEKERHKIKNELILEIVCNNCITTQMVSNTCINCKINFGTHFCKKCVLWCNDSACIFHCDLCGFCRVGEKDLYFHCEICNSCIEVGLKGVHKHVENTLKSDCPICAEYLFTSRKDSILLRCGHSIHTECYSFYAERSHQCPICMKSMGGMDVYNRRVEKIVKSAEELNPKTSTWTCEVLCHDCGCESKSNYRYLFNKCPSCASYNTRLNQIHKNTYSSKCIASKKMSEY